MASSSKTQRWYIAIFLVYAALTQGCSDPNYVYATSLQHPDTGNVHVCRSDNIAAGDPNWDSVTREAHDRCVQQLQSIGYEVTSQSESVRQ